MWIRRLEVTHCAGIAAAGIDLKPGLNVLHGPNELGKSSLVAAIRAALLVQSSATVANALRDWNSVESPTVSLVFEQEAARIWRVRKTFGRSGHAYLDFSKDGVEFTTDSKGREVDGTLQNLLRWGIEAPGGRSGRRGMPSSFISTALLGEQSDVVGILGRSLGDDASASGRDRLTNALQALAEDPRFKQVVDTVQEKVDEAFTATGRKRSGRGSPWADLREKREHAAIRERNVRQQVDESVGVRTQVADLSGRLFDARTQAEHLTTTLAHRRQRAEAEQRLAAATEHFKTVGRALAQLAANQDAVATTRARVAELEVERTTLAKALATTTAEVEAAREQLRELETGADEKERRLREQETENRRLTLAQKRATHQRRAADAKALAATEAKTQAAEEQIATREATLAEKRELLHKAREASELDRDKLAELELEKAVTGYLVAQEAVKAVEAERDAARQSLSRAEELERQAVTLRDDAESLNAPDDQEYERLRAGETQWRVADAKRSVGFLTELTLAGAADAKAEVDGEARMLQLVPGKSVEVEANQEFKLEVADLLTVRVRGGGRDLLAEAQAAAERWQAASQPVFARTGCTTLDELAALRKRGDDLVAQATDLERQAETARQRAESLDQLEQRVLAETANRQRLQDAVAEFLNEGEAVADLVASVEAPRRDDTAISRDIATLGEAVRARDRLCDRMDNDIEADVREIEARQRELDAETAQLAERAEDAGDWRAFLADADAAGARIDQELHAVETELEVIRTQATAEVDAARRALDDLVKREAGEQQALHDKSQLLSRTGTDLARLEGETGPLKVNAEGKDLRVAQADRDAAHGALAALPAAEADDDIDTLERDAERAALLVRTLETDLRKAEGALEQMGGQYLDEQLQEVKDEAKALDTRERELDMDYGAWRLLRETLADAEQSGAAHLGNALVGRVSQRMGALTGGRYGDVAIGPQLDATGIEFAGGERAFQTLSVGTQEQIALLLRLAIAEALGTFVILDDQLTQSDAGRMAWLRDLLAKTAQSIQVVVLTCHPDDYQIDVRNVVDLMQCITRSDASAGATLPDRSEGKSGSTSPTRRRHRPPPASDQTGDDLAAALRKSLERRGR